LFFFSDPVKIDREWKKGSILLCPQRTYKEMEQLDGIYQAGFIGFKRTKTAFQCLNWWRTKCIEWCYYTRDHNRFTDQKYLDQWPALFRDVAIIKIDDPKFKSFGSLPYGIRKSTSELAEPIFTLGFPRDEIVYGEGYLSARTGFNGDTLSCQIAVPANPGNSGGPVFNHEGDVIGILTGKQTEADDVVFAIQSKYIYQAVDNVKKNPIYQNVKIPSRTNNLSGLTKQQQVKKLEDCVFMVKGD